MRILLIGLLAAAVAGVVILATRDMGKATVAERVDQYGKAARERLAPFFKAAGVAYPPERFLLLGLKHEKELHLFAGNKHIRSYPIKAASGTLGPKLKNGDRQVPEGIYRIESLNPNSKFHLSLRLNYPNDDDRARGGGGDLGGDIMIHGRSASIGCLAMGDEAVEELFVLAADSRWEEAVVILSPVDFRRTNHAPVPAGADELYSRIRLELRSLPPW